MLSDIYGKGVCYKVKNIFYFPLEDLLISAFAQVFLAIRTKIIQVFLNISMLLILDGGFQFYNRDRMSRFVSF